MTKLDIDIDILYDADVFPILFISDDADKLTNDNLLFNDLYLDTLRSCEKIEDFDAGRFSKTFDEIIKKGNDLKTIRSLLLSFALKNMIDPLRVLEIALTEDIISHDENIEYNDNIELFTTNHLIFNNIFFNELSRHPTLMLDVIETMKSYYSGVKTLQYESSYYIIQQIIFTNEESITPVPSDKLIFLEEKDIEKEINKQDEEGKKKILYYIDKVKNSCPIILPFEMRYREYMNMKPPSIKVSLEINRKDILSSIWSLEFYKNVNVYFDIQFSGEPGIDYGGLTKEFIEIAFKEIVKPKNDLFVLRGNYYFFKHHNFKDDKQKEEYKKKYYCIGILFGIAILNKLTIPFHFPPYFYKKLIHRDISMRDLICFDQDKFQRIQEMISETLTKDSLVDYSFIDPLSREEVNLFNFQIVDDVNKKNIPEPLTDENKDTYITDILRWLFIISIKVEFQAFEKGFCRVTNRPILYHAFRLDEIDRIVSGVYQRDWEEMKSGVHYSGYTKDSKTVQLFWNYFDEMDEEGKLNVMRFIRASTSTPPGGMKDIHITINKVRNKGCPVAHTCNETLDLPEYKTAEELKDKCDIGFAYSNSFDIR